MPDNRTYDEVRENDDASVLFDIMYRNSDDRWHKRFWQWKVKAPWELRVKRIRKYILSWK